MLCHQVGAFDFSIRRCSFSQTYLVVFNHARDAQCTRCAYEWKLCSNHPLLPSSLKSIAINYFNYLIWTEAVINWHFVVLFPCTISPSLSNEHHKNQWHHINHNDMIVLLWKIGKSFFFGLGDTFRKDTICEKKALYQDIFAPDVFHVFFFRSFERCCVYARQATALPKVDGVLTISLSKYWRFMVLSVAVWCRRASITRSA